jgi:hypothetical protein
VPEFITFQIIGAALATAPVTCCTVEKLASGVRPLTK